MNQEKLTPDEFRVLADMVSPQRLILCRTERFEAVHAATELLAAHLGEQEEGSEPWPVLLHEGSQGFDPWRRNARWQLDAPIGDSDAPAHSRPFILLIKDFDRMSGLDQLAFAHLIDGEGKETIRLPTGCRIIGGLIGESSKAAVLPVASRAHHVYLESSEVEGSGTAK
jgi:hypothetical protein